MVLMDATLVASIITIDMWIIGLSFNWIYAIVAILVALPVFTLFGLYKSVYKYLGLPDVMSAFKATGLFAFLFSTLLYLASETISTQFPWITLDASVSHGISSYTPEFHWVVVSGFIFWITSLIVVAVPRVLTRSVFADLILTENASRSNQRRALIYGSGEAGYQLASILRFSTEFEVVGFFDDSSDRIGKNLLGLPIVSPSRLSEQIHSFEASAVLIAMPSASQERISHIVSKLDQEGILVKALPCTPQLISGKVRAQDLQEFPIENLLGREAVAPNESLLQQNIFGKQVLITGAGGSIGAELCRQVLTQSPTTLVLVDSSEFALYSIHKELENAQHGTTIVPVLGSVLDSNDMRAACTNFNIHTIFHAAAYKHVPMVEYNPVVGVKNNVFGTLCCAQAAKESGVKAFVLISTDKAVRPTNTMGASKRMAEMILQCMGRFPHGATFEQWAPQPKLNPVRSTEKDMQVSIVRFGNVLGSSGSVIPLFRDQIARGGPITVTDPEITRYFMTIPEAAQLVIQAGSLGEQGDVFVLDMGDSVKIVDLAKRMIALSGLKVKSPERPNGDIEIKYTGLRPGEKLYEELLIGDDIMETEHPLICRASETCLSPRVLRHGLERLEKSISENDSTAVRAILRELIPQFVPQSSNMDVLQPAIEAPSSNAELFASRMRQDRSAVSRSTTDVIKAKSEFKSNRTPSE